MELLAYTILKDDDTGVQTTLKILGGTIGIVTFLLGVLFGTSRQCLAVICDHHLSWERREIKTQVITSELAIT